jgi:DNA-binding PadR family transcriptional regulator
VARHFSITDDRNQDLYSGLIRLHILHHASEEPIFGLGMIEELGRHGYRLSAGTIYPMLHRLETNGLLRSQEERNGRRRRRTYRATRSGEKALAAAKQKVWELFSELFEDQHSGKRNGTSRRKQ